VTVEDQAHELPAESPPPIPDEAITFDRQLPEGKSSGTVRMTIKAAACGIPAFQKDAPQKPKPGRVARLLETVIKNADHLPDHVHFRETKIEDLGIEDEKELQALRENVGDVVFNIDAGTEFDDRLFVPIQDAAGAAVDLPLQLLRSLQRISLILYRKNVRAYSMVETVKDFALGRGTQVISASKITQAVIDQHWEINEWDEKLEGRARGLGIFGEQLWETFIRDGDGLVTLGSILPLRILGVKTDEEDGNRADAVFVVEETVPVGAGSAFTQDGGAFNVRGRPLTVIQMQRDGKLEGEAFFFCVNKIDGAQRGLPDLSPSVDWLEGLDGFVFSLMERAELASDVVFDLEFEDLDENELRAAGRAFMDTHRAGEAFAHNQKVKLTIVSPDLKGSDAEKVISILLRQIQAGTRLAGLFYGDADDLTRASATELSLPVMKAIEGRQEFIRRMIRKVIAFQIQKAQEAGKIPAGEDTTFEVVMPQVSLRDLATVAGALVSLKDALRDAMDLEWISWDEARRIFRTNVGELGTVLRTVALPGVGNTGDQAMPDQPPRAALPADERETLDLFESVGGSSG
jgi:hypothetical protein